MVVVVLSLLGERVGGSHGTVERWEVVETGLVVINVVRDSFVGFSCFFDFFDDLKNIFLFNNILL